MDKYGTLDVIKAYSFNADAPCSKPLLFLQMLKACTIMLLFKLKARLSKLSCLSIKGFILKLKALLGSYMALGGSTQLKLYDAWHIF